MNLVGIITQIRGIARVVLPIGKEPQEQRAKPSLLNAGLALIAVSSVACSSQGTDSTSSPGGWPVWAAPLLLRVVGARWAP